MSTNTFAMSASTLPFDKLRHQETCDELARFVEARSPKSIVGKRPDERWTRDDMDLRLQLKTRGDEHFRQEFMAHPRFMYALAVEESLGIPSVAFLRVIDSVAVLQETPERMYLVLPSCHKGCEARPAAPPEGVCAGSCHVCGITFPTHTDNRSTCEQWEAVESAAPTRKEIEDLLKKKAALDHSFKKELTSRPVEIYTAFATKLCGGAGPSYMAGVKEIQVLEEGERDVYFLIQTPTEGA